MESGHGDAAVLLIKKGADRGRVRSCEYSLCLAPRLTRGAWKTNMDGQTPEELEGLGDREQKRVREYVVMQCGKYE